MEPTPTTKQIQFNKGINGLSDKLTATITAEPNYLRIRIINLVFLEGYGDAAEIVIDIPDKDKLVVANYIENNQFSGFRTIGINKEYEFITSTFILTIDDNKVSKFNFHFTYEDINE